MVSYCCVKGCGNNSRKKDSNSVTSFHAIPSNQELKSKWLKAIGRPNWEPPTHTRVCSAHFNQDQINYEGSRIRVKDDAFPVKYLPPNSNFEASNVEACRICLATDAKMFSLQDTNLGTCMDSIVGFSQLCIIDGLPQYVCYQCAPGLINCNKLIERCMTSQTILLDIFAKNGQITKTLIKKQNKAQLNLKSSSDNSLLSKDSLINHDVNPNSHDIIPEPDAIESKGTHIKYEDDRNKETDMQATETVKCEFETSEIEFNEIDTDDVDDEEAKIIIHVDEAILDKDVKEELSLNAHKDKICVRQETNIEKKLVSKKGKTPNERIMSQYFDIVTLSLDEQIQEWERSTVRRPLTSETIYHCEICNKPFANYNTYRLHVTYHDPSHGRSECQVCKLRFKNAVLATSHAKRAHSIKLFCKICLKTFNNVVVAKKHQRWHSGYLYKCDTCRFSTLHASALGAHKRRAHALAHTCALCGRPYSSRQGLALHTQIAHKNVKEADITKEFRCEQCDIDFASEGAKRVHILTSFQHWRKSDLCDETVQELNLQNSCNKCGIEYASFKELVLHKRAEHPRQHPSQGDTSYPISCEVCGETISSRKKHWLHVRRQHPKNIDTYQPVITAICDTCGKGFQNTTKLRLHQLRHGSPTVRCHRCPRMFYDKYALTRHASTHSADKPHQCRTCGRTFKLQGNLERHFRVHTDIAPYECTMCGKKFKHSTSVNLHIRTVHYKLPHPPRRRSKAAKDASDS